ncbi:hypothetical protein C8N24_4399 [Solirubrobacter pauli]|uniref:Uncharacterized protein n=1 Tax=Solirubrobacter pauli TaxID=166793 RepID=A0A660KZ03_9ACTN|nr:hypothetical protein [Solirubrobacter pauli]RKQ86388.1 hypothetical protein C8N24_4399 [Solirubrobacter pauli]
MLLASPPASVAAITPVAAFRGTVAYSRYERGAYALILRRDGHEIRARTAPRAVPFDVDLGPDGRGVTVAVYSRCATEPAYAGTGAVTYPGGGSAQGCRAVLYDPATARERVLTDGYLPAIWHTTLVYARPDGLFARVDGRTRRVEDGGGRAVERSGVDVYGTHVAVARELDLRTELVLTGVGARPRVLDARDNGISTRFMRFPGFSAGRLRWADTCAGDPAGCRRRLHRYRLRDRTRASTRSPSAYLTGYAVDGARTYLVRAREDAWGDALTDGCPCRVTR